MTRRLVFHEEADSDLLGIYEYIAHDATPQRALRYIDRIRKILSRSANIPAAREANAWSLFRRSRSWL